VIITVVATGFGVERGGRENALVRRVNQANQTTVSAIPTQAQRVLNENIERDIAMEDDFLKTAFPAKKILKSEMIIDEKIQPRPISNFPENQAVQEEDELEIPAFIRRKMER